MNSDLYTKKNRYEKFINSLNENYASLELCYINLISCKKIICTSLNINNNIFQCTQLDKIIKNIILPKARNEYNNILLEISKL